MAESLLTVALFHEPSGWALPDRYVDQLRDAAGGKLDVRRVTGRAELLDVLPDTTHLIGFPITEEQFRSQGASLEWIQLAHSSGDESDALIAALENNVLVTSASAVRAPQVAEHAMALALALARRLDSAIHAQGEHRWAADELSRTMRTLNGLNVGILSQDRIDAELSRRAAAFGAHTIALRRLDGTEDDGADEVFDAAQADEVIRRADVLIVAMSRMRASRRLINAQRLALMKPTAVLVDVSRSGVVEQEALLRALRRQKIAGAGLDVFDSEPLPRTSPLWTMANVIITPHVCAATPDYWGRATTFFCENVRRIVSGETPIDILRPEWYSLTSRGANV